MKNKGDPLINRKPLEQLVKDHLAGRSINAREYNEIIKLITDCTLCEAELFIYKFISSYINEKYSSENFDQ